MSDEVRETLLGGPATRGIVSEPHRCIRRMSRFGLTLPKRPVELARYNERQHRLAAPTPTAHRNGRGALPPPGPPF